MNKSTEFARSQESKWVSLHAQAQGSSHTVCQDRTACIMGSVNVIALADGLSACRHSEQGARIVTEKACQELSRCYWEYFQGRKSPKELVEILQNTVKQYANARTPYDEMCSTLLFCAISEDTYILGHIGDGGIAQFGKDSYLICEPMVTPRGGTSSYSILDEDAAEHFRLLTGSTQDLDGFLLTSDGLKGRSYAQVGQVLPSTAFKYFAAAREWKDLSEQERTQNLQKVLSSVAAKPDADDCSLAILSRTTMTGHVDYTKPNGYNLRTTWPCTCGHFSSLGEIRCGRCQQERSAIYKSVKIASPGGFFSDLQNWLTSGKDEFEISRYSGQILDKAEFKKLCRRLRSEAVQAVATSCVPEPEAVIDSSAPAQKFPIYAKSPGYTKLPENYSLVFDIEGGGKRTRYHLDCNCLRINGKPVKSFSSTPEALQYLRNQLPTMSDMQEYRHWQWSSSPDICILTSLEKALKDFCSYRDNSMLPARGTDYELLYALEKATTTITLSPLDRSSKPVWHYSLRFTKKCIWCIYNSQQEIYFGTVSPDDYAQQLMEALLSAANTPL